MGRRVSVDFVLSEGRRAAESIMTDSCLVERATGTVTDDSGHVVTTYAPVYDGKCRFQYRGLSAGSPNVGDQRIDLFSLELQIPISVTTLAVNDRVTPQTSRDPDLPGRRFRVANLAHKSHYTARRMPLEEVTS